MPHAAFCLAFIIRISPFHIGPRSRPQPTCPARKRVDLPSASSMAGGLGSPRSRKLPANNRQPPSPLHSAFPSLLPWRLGVLAWDPAFPRACSTTPTRSPTRPPADSCLLIPAFFPPRLCTSAGEPLSIADFGLKSRLFLPSSVPPRLRERHSLACRGAHEDAKTRRRSKNYGGGEFCLLNPDF